MSELRTKIGNIVYELNVEPDEVDGIVNQILDSVKQVLTEKTLDLKAVSHDRRVFVQVIGEVLEK